MDLKKLAKVEYSDQRVLTSEQISEFYGCTTDNIKKNFNVNKERFIEGKHYFKVEGEALKNLRVTFSNLQISPMTRALFLWTKRGAARLAKMLSTDKAWEVFEILEDNYFDSKENTEFVPQYENAVAVQNSAELKLLVAPALKDVETSIEIVEKIFFVQHGIALAHCINAAEKNHQVDLSEFKNLLPPAEHEIGYLTATQIGKNIGKSAQYVNKKLLEFEFQEKDGHGGYILTDKGKDYGEAMPFERNGHAGYQIKWAEEIVKLFN
mgnify:CR=1 FL=1